MLPEVKQMQLQPNIFPTKWQAVLFHNYGFVPAADLARVLGCEEKALEEERARLGLEYAPFQPVWRKKGYITLIRNNWFLLPYEQICDLLGIKEDRLDFILRNDDFLWVKLGDKPYCEKVCYTPLTKEQIEKTNALAKQIKEYVRPQGMQPFEFFKKGKNTVSTRTYLIGKRIVHGYLSPCGDAFIEDSVGYMPDELLEEYASRGINGVWLHGVLSALSPYPFDESLSKDYPLRRKNMQALIDRCAKYGIKLYLYLNEPRALPENKFGKYAHLIGRKEDGYAALCFEQKETREYLYNAVKDLLCGVQGLGGIITITMSENLTHCNYRQHTNCPVCKNIPPEKSASAVNNVIQKAIRDSGKDVELIANLWGWSPFTGWTEEQTLRGVEMLDKDISVLCVSEYDLDIEKGGVKSKIIDYSISNPGPSEITKKTLKKAGERGNKTYAKIQTNNSWECSAVPYLPVFDLLYEHLKNLSQIGVKDYMLTWTLGGYPSPMLSMVASYAQDSKSFNLDKWYQEEYGDDCKLVKKAVGHFCEGFKDYPFSIDGLYFSPKTLGSANLWSLEKQEKRSTMVCYAYDDFENWTQPYPVDIYLSQYEKLLLEWKKGLDILHRDLAGKFGELTTFAKAAFAHFKADYLQTKFAMLKRDKEKNRAALKGLLQEEKSNAEMLLSLLYEDGRIGFEASNHYYYTDRNLVEKIILMDQLSESL